MKCVEARTFIQLYLDSELDPAKSLEVERHLESCEECAGLFEAEKRFNARVVTCLRANAQPTPNLWSGIEAKLLSGSLTTSARKTHRRLIAWLLPIAAVIALTIGGITTWRWTRPSELAVAAIECHRNTLGTEREAEFTVQPPDDDALRHTGGRLDTQAFQYRPATPGFKLKGVRADRLASVPVAAIVGQYEATPVSLFVLKTDELSHFPEARRRLESGEPVVCYRTKGFEFAARLIDGHVVCAVADLSQQVLEAFLNTVAEPAAAPAAKI